VGASWGWPWVNLAVALLENLGYVWMAYRRVAGLRLFPWRRDASMAREFHVQAAAGAVVQLASLVLLKTDPILVKAVLPLHAVALYAVALKVAENYLMFLKQFLPVLTPRLGAAAARRDLEALRRLIIQSSGWATVPAMALGLPLLAGRGRIAGALGRSRLCGRRAGLEDPALVGDCFPYPRW
jgi:O-antigen/teichoic acid export membrane protein